MKNPLTVARRRIIKINREQTNLSLNISFELPENHFSNKMVRNMEKTNVGDGRKSLWKIKKKMIRSKVTKSGLFKERKLTLQKARVHSVPQSLQHLPIIPFWRSSFEIIDNIYMESSYRPPPAEPHYLTMKAKPDCEAIYV